MRKWVRYDKVRGLLVDTIDQKKLKRKALALKQYCKENKNNQAVPIILQLFSERIERAIWGKIDKPEQVPHMLNYSELVDMNDEFMTKVGEFSYVLRGCNEISLIVGRDEFYKENSPYLKEIDGQWFVLEEFEE